MRLVYGMFFFFLLFVDTMKFIPYINYWDELTMILAPLCVLIIKRGNIRMNNEKKVNCFILLCLIIMGILGNMCSPGIQRQNIAIYKDVVAFLKFPIIMMVWKEIGDSYGKNFKAHRAALQSASVVAKFFLLSGLIGVFAGKIFDLGFYTGEIRIIDCYKFIYSHPTYFVSALVMCVVVLVAEGLKKNRSYIIISCGLIFMAQRFKGYAFIVFTLMFLLVNPVFVKKIFSFRSKTKIRGKYIIPICIVGVTIVYFVFRKRFATYLRWGMTSARIALYVVGTRILIDKFPLGSGFGTFASYLSGEYYSNIYHTYGISNVDGLRMTKYNYMSDTFWPWVYGQLGFFGVLNYLMLFYRFFKSQLESLKKYDHIVAFVLLWIYAIIASSCEAYFTDASGVIMATVLNVFIGSDEINKEATASA